MRYRFIAVEKAHYPISLLCRLLQVSRSGYYAWCKRGPSRRAVANAMVVQQMRAVHQRVRQRYGSPRMHKELRAQGVAIGRHRVARLMRQAGLVVRRPRRFRGTTQSKHSRLVAPNVLQRNFHSTAPNQKWVGDISYIPTQEGWLYLAVLLDLYARRVVGWSMRDRLKDELTVAALDMALKRRRPPANLLHHSDRGSQYASQTYRKRLRRHGLCPSMSRVGNCWDNAVVESFFASLKVELIHQRTYATRDEARQDLFEYIEIFYNQQRRHSTLGYLSPAEFERRYMTNAVSI